MTTAEEKEIELIPGCTVKMRPVNMFEQMTADSYAQGMVGKIGTTDANLDIRTKCWAICSIRALNGVERNPLSSVNEFMSLGRDIPGAATFALQNAYLEMSGLGAPKGGAESANPLDPTPPETS